MAYQPAAQVTGEIIREFQVAKTQQNTEGKVIKNGSQYIQAGAECQSD